LLSGRRTENGVRGEGYLISSSTVWPSIYALARTERNLAGPEEGNSIVPYSTEIQRKFFDGRMLMKVKAKMLVLTHLHLDILFLEDFTLPDDVEDTAGDSKHETVVLRA